MPDTFVLPKYAYVPGKTPRHPEGSFDHIRDTVADGMTPAALAQSNAFLTGLHYLETGFCWEAHEVLEPVWLALSESKTERPFVQALIQFANAKLKFEMDRRKAAKRLCGIVRDLLSGVKEPTLMGLDVSQIWEELDSFEQSLNGAL